MSGLLLISPVRNEAEHIERVAHAVAAQKRRPDLWIVVDDGSDDGTVEILEALREEIPFMRVVPAPVHGEMQAAADRLAMAAAPRAFNCGLATVSWQDFDHIGKLDGDVELPEDYFEEVLNRFADDEGLGIAGGVLVERFGDRLRLIRIPREHVHGALKLYSRACFEAIGGVEERLGWDTIDETYARMRGFGTHSFLDIVAHHHRHFASAGGRLRGRARHGRCAYIAHYSAWWVLLRSVKLAAAKPYGIGGVAFLAGYVHAAIRAVPRVDDREFRRFVRSELRLRLVRALRPGSRPPHPRMGPDRELAGTRG